MISPWKQGATLPPMQATFMYTDGTPVPLTGAAMSLQIVSKGSGLARAGTGTWQIADATNGKAIYNWSAADVATPGYYELVAIADFGNGEQARSTADWQVEPTNTLQ